MLKRFSGITMNDVATCGGKGASLGEMMSAGLPIPNGFVVTTEAYGKNSKEWEKKVLQAFDKLNTKFVAVRSSGTKEDGADDSFAGQFDTYLFVTRENLIEKIKECHDSVNSERIVSYCEYKGIDIKSIKVAVVVQKMVNSESAGVCFTVNPVSQNYDEIMIDAGFGVGEAVVSGMITPDNYIVNKKTGEINKIISQQEKKLVLSDKGGTKEVDIPKEEQNNQKLSDKHIQELAKLAKKIEQHYGKPMDTEWAIENGELFMLQARPITTLIKNESLVDKFVSSLNDKDNLLPPITTSSIFVQACIELYANHMPHYIKDNTPMNGLSLYHGGETYTYIDGTKLINITNTVIKLFFTGDLTSDDIFKDFNQYANQIDYDYKHYNYEYLKKLSNKKLFELANKTINSFLDFDATSLFAITVDENSLEKYFAATNQVYNLPKNFYKYASNIPTLSFDKKQIEDIISCIKNGGLNKENLEKLQYLGTSYSKYTSIEYMEDFLLNNYRITPDFAKDETIKLKKEKERVEKLKKKYDTWYLTLTSQQQLLASFIRMSIEFRDKRKNYTLKALCTISRIMEIFFDKNGLDKKYLWNIGFGEILSGPDYILGLKDKLALREEGSVFFSDYNQQKLLVQEGYDAFADAFEKVQSLYNTNTQGNIIQGISGSSGKAKGVVKIIQFLDKDNQFQVGDILVTGMTRPEFVPLMKKASAIITDEGGITCHAAIVSRELGIPCVIGTKIATQVLKDGDIVEVDADNGIIKLENNKTGGNNSLNKPSKQRRYTIYPAGDFNTSFISNYSVVLGYTKFPKLLGLPICDGPHVVRNGDLEYIFDMSTWDACEKSIVEKMDKDINYIDNLTDKMMGEGKNLCERIKKKSQNPNLKKLKNEELLKILEEFIEYQSNIYAYGTSFNFIGYGEDNYITKNLNKIFKEKNIPEGKINEVMEIFTYPYKDSFSQQQKIEILELLNKYINRYKKDFINDCKNKDLKYIQKKYSDFFEELKSHSEKYSRLSFGFTGPASNISDFFNDIKKIISDKVSINDRLESIKNKRIDNEKKKKFWMNKLNPNKNEKLLLETAGKIVRAKPTRKDYQSQAYCLLEPIIIEISNRLQTDTSTVWQMSISNMREFLKGKYDSNLQAKFQSFYICVPKNPEKVDVLTGENAHEFYDDNVLIEKDGIDVQDNVIHGNTACNGSAKGVVKIINSKNDMSKMETGNILVSVATSPSIVAAMKKAAAIITDSGGLTCHAAIVSRELGIPCVIGTKIATQVLKDGDLVEVDADNGIIKILENESKGDKLEVKIGNKTFTPESRSHSQVYFNYQGLPFFTSLFEKCSALEESRYSTSGLYISKFTGDNKIVSYCAGDFISKGYNMINDLLDQKDDAKKFLAQKNDLVIECIKKCEEYINSKRTDFFNIWNDIQTAFAAGRYVFNISHALQDYLDKLKESNYDLFECLQLNISPREETFLNKAETYLLNLVDKNPNDFDIVYRKFMDKYYWFQNSYLGVKTITKDWLFNYYETLISKRQVNEVETKKPELPDKYKLLIETASDAAFYQDNKKRLGLIANVIMDRWLKDISKQTNIPYDDLIWLAVVEIESYDISTKKGVRDLKNKISNYKNLGKRFWVLNENIYVDTNEDLRSKVVNLNTGNGDGIIVKGAVGNKGKYIGKAKIVLNIEKDGKKLEKGDILVTGMTRPEFLPMMQRAGAFITDEGGITCHAAIVSRELGKPCIIGTKIATQVLKDGDLVEVDADNGIVKILENTNGEKETGTRSSSDLTKKFNELKRYNQRDIQTFNAYPFFINSVATVSAFNLLPYDLHYTQILCEYENDTVKWHYDVKDYENLGKIFWGKCKSTNELLKLIDKYDIDYRQSEKEFDKALSIYKKNKSEDNRTRLLEKSVKFLACGAGSAHILECASYYAEKYFTKGKIITPHDESFLSKAHKLAKKLKSEYDLKKAYKEFLKKYGWIKNTYLGRNTISIQEFSDLADEKDLKFTTPKYKKNSIEGMISYTFNRQDNRKENIFKAIEKVDEVLNQISKDTGINKKSLSYMLPNEVSNIKNKDFQKELENRRLYFIDYKTKEEHYFSSKHIDEQKNEEKLNELKEIKGSIGNPGKVTGTARVCQNLESIKNFNEGEILVTSMTRPEFITAMRKASAFVTDEGGITCHAAIISRELGKPCIIGTKIATKAIKDGDLIEVDADNGIIKILENDSEGDNLEVKIGKKNFTPEFRKHENSIHLSYQGVPFFSCVFSKCCTTNDTNRTTPANYVCEFNNLETTTQYVIGDFVEKGENMIENMIKGKKDASIFLKKQNEIVLKCIEKCDKYIKDGKTNFLDIRSDIKLAFEAGCHVINLSYALQKYLENLSRTNQKLYKNISENINAPKKSFVNEAGDYLKELIQKHPDNFEMVYNEFMIKYGWFQNSYLGINHINKKRLKEYAEDLLKAQISKKSKKRLKIEKKYSILVETASNAIIYQDNKKRLGFMAMQIMENRLRDYSKKIKIPYNDLLWLTVEEIIENDVKTIKDKINEYKHTGKRIGIMTEKGYTTIPENFLLKVVELNKPQNDIKSFNGMTGCKGKHTGNVKIISNIEKDKNKFKKGDILVTGMTRPEFVPLIKKSGGIITNEGGITCHAAIISRELQKPCIVGTKIATQVLKDGDLVEVDADNGIVKILENENGEIVKTNKFSVDDFIYSMGKGKKSDIKIVEDFLNNSDWDVQRFNASPVFVNPTGMGNNYIFQNYFGISYSGFFFNYRGHQREMGYNLKDFHRLWAKLGNSYLHPGFVEKVANDYYDIFSYFENVFKQIDDGLVIDENNIIEMLKIVNRAQCYSVGIAHSTELINYICSYELKPILEDAIGKEKFREIESKIFVADSLSFFAVEQNELYKIAKLKKGDEQDKLLREHLKKWNWILNSYVGAKELDVEFFVNRMEKVLHDGEIKLNLKQRDKLIGSLSISEKDKNIIKLINYTTSRHDNRKANILKTIGYFDKILRKLSIISKIKFEDLLYLSFSDIDGLNNLRDLIDMEEELKQRRKGVIYILNDLKEYIYTKNDYIKLNGILEKLYAEQSAKELKGFVANKGYVKGKVRICNSMEKIGEFKEGEILVASMTRPEYISAIKKCIAIITDEGGITCHAAIVSRELGKPCIIGTKIATQVLTDGDFVEVDADNGIIKIL